MNAPKDWAFLDCESVEDVATTLKMTEYAKRLGKLTYSAYKRGQSIPSRYARQHVHQLLIIGKPLLISSAEKHLNSNKGIKDWHNMVATEICRIGAFNNKVATMYRRMIRAKIYDVFWRFDY